MASGTIKNDILHSKITAFRHNNWSGIDSVAVQDVVATIVLKSTSEGYGADLYIDNVLVAENTHTYSYYLTYILTGAHTIKTTTSQSIVDIFLTPLDA